MNTIIERVIFVALLNGDPPRLLFRKDLRQADGQSRTFTEAVPLLEASPCSQIAAELKPGDEIELSVAYDYSAPGWPSHVTEYHKVGIATTPFRQGLAAA